MPQGMSHDPAAIIGHGIVVGLSQFVQPCLADIKGDLKVILGNVAQVVGDRPTHIQFGIILQQFEQR